MSYKLFELIPVLQNGDPASDFTVPVTVQGGGGGGSVTVADGADVAEGATTDAAVVTDANGTISGKLRGLIVILLRAFALATPIRIDPVGSTAQPVTGTFYPAASASVASAQIALGAVAAALSTVSCSEVLISADIDNTVDALVGSASAQAYRLPPGANTGWVKVSNWNVFYGKYMTVGTCNLNILSRA